MSAATKTMTIVGLNIFPSPEAESPRRVSRRQMASGLRRRLYAPRSDPYVSADALAMWSCGHIGQPRRVEHRRSIRPARGGVPRRVTSQTPRTHDFQNDPTQSIPISHEDDDGPVVETTDRIHG